MDGCKWIGSKQPRIRRVSKKLFTCLTYLLTSLLTSLLPYVLTCLKHLTYLPLCTLLTLHTLLTLLTLCSQFPNIQIKVGETPCLQ